MKTFREYLAEAKIEKDVRINEGEIRHLGNSFESEPKLLFTELKEKLNIAEKVYKDIIKNPENALGESMSFFKKFPPKSVKVKGINLDLNSGFIDAHIDFLLEIEKSDKPEIITEKIRYSIDKKKFI